jgi:hypothetical protein
MVHPSSLQLWLLTMGFLLCFSTVFSLEDTKRNSYVCLEENDDLCIGISPGWNVDPVFNPNEIDYLQVKPRSKNEIGSRDFQKMRWDLSYGQGRVALSNYGYLCAAKQALSDRAGVFPCDDALAKTYSNNITFGRWNINALRKDTNQVGTMMLAGNTKVCLTAMRCETPPGADFCDPESKLVAWDDVGKTIYDLRRGSFLRFRKCYDAEGGNPAWKPLQLWKQKIDCAIGCPIDLQENNVCDVACNKTACNFDNGACLPFTGTKIPTKAPTPPTPPTTFSPTLSPTIPCPADGDIEFCNRWKNKETGCINNKRAKTKCSWCLDSCRPNSDPRYCAVPGIYDGCKPQCPTLQQKIRCEKSLTKRDCLKGGVRACAYCPLSKKCFPGYDTRVCTDPSFYSHCPFTPGPPPCPKKSTLAECRSTQTRDACSINPRCTWCQSAVTDKCRLKAPIGYTTGYCAKEDYLTSIFGHCPLLQPVTSTEG